MSKWLKTVQPWTSCTSITFCLNIHNMFCSHFQFTTRKYPPGNVHVPKFHSSRHGCHVIMMIISFPWWLLCLRVVVKEFTVNDVFLSVFLKYRIYSQLYFSHTVFLILYFMGNFTYDFWGNFHARLLMYLKIGVESVSNMSIDITIYFERTVGSTVVSENFVYYSG